MNSERNLSDKEVSKIISEIKDVRTVDSIRITSKGAMYERPIDIIVNDSRNVIVKQTASEHTNGNNPDPCD